MGESPPNSFEEWGPHDEGTAIAWTTMMSEWISERRSPEYGWPSGEVYLLHEDLHWRSERDQSRIAALTKAHEKAEARAEKAEWMLANFENAEPQLYDHLAARWEEEQAANVARNVHGPSES